MLDLYAAATPNGHKVSIALEELGLPYELKVPDLSMNEQKTPAFLAINPNGRIPAIVDREADDFAVFESGAILICLAEKTGRLMPTDAKGRSRVLQWLMFQMRTHRWSGVEVDDLPLRRHSAPKGAARRTVQ